MYCNRRVSTYFLWGMLLQKLPPLVVIHTNTTGSTWRWYIKSGVVWRGMCFCVQTMTQYERDKYADSTICSPILPTVLEVATPPLNGSQNLLGVFSPCLNADHL